MRELTIPAGAPTSPDDARIYLAAEGGGPVRVPAGFPLFAADFARAGDDLHVTAPDGAELRVIGYFSDGPTDLALAGGGTLKAATAALLAGPEAPGQFAQAGAVQSPQPDGNPIGQVETVEGTATVQRSDGTEDALAVGEQVFLGDVVSTGPGGTVSITFVDGTIFTLQPGSRMTLDELVYTAGADSGNSAAFSLVQGSFVFIAGQVAPTGGIEITTPAATMGVRGTTIVIDVFVDANGENVTEVRLVPDPVTLELGIVEVFDGEGNQLGTVETDETDFIVRFDTDDDTGQETLRFQQIPRSEGEAAEASALLAAAAAAFDSAAAREASGQTLVEGSSGATNAAPVEGGSSQDDLDTGAGDGVDDSGLGTPDTPDEGADDTDPADEVEPDAGAGGDDDARIFLPRDPLLIDGLDGKLATSEDTALSGALPGGPPGSDQRFTLVSGPSDGTLVLGESGDFAYVPDGDFSGTDSFTFDVQVTQGGVSTRSSGSVLIVVNPVNDPPVLAAAKAVATEDGAVVAGALVGTDADAGDTLTYAVEGPVPAGFALDPNGGWTFDPGVSAYQALADGENVVVEVPVSVTDAAGDSASATLEIDVTGANDAPSAQDTEVTGAEDTEIRVPVTIDDIDGDDLTLGFQPDAKKGSVKLVDGELVYTPDADANGTDSFTYTVSDGTVTTAATAKVSVTPVNDAPVVLDASARVLNGTATGQLVVRDADVPKGTDPAAAFSFAVGTEGPANGSVEIADDGSFTYTPDAGFTGFDGFEVRVEDGAGGVGTARVAVIVGASEFVLDGRTAGGDDAPPLQDIEIAVAREGGADSPAGGVQVSMAPPPQQKINLVVLLDRSSSQFQTWEEQKQAVAAALTDTTDDTVASLFERFEGSASEIDVHVVSHARGVTRIGGAGNEGRVYNLATDRTELRDDILAAEFDEVDSQASSYGLALREARAILDEAGAAEAAANHVFFVSDGNAPNDTSDGLQKAITALKDPDLLGYEVTIEAFGIGNEVDLDAPDNVLDEIDSNDAQLVEDPSDIAAAFQESPLFPAQLTGLSVQLIADGTFLGEVATEETPGFEGGAGDLSYALADIPGIADMIGERSNVFLIEAGFDLDDDPSTTEITLRTGEAFEIGDTAVDRTGTAQSDLLFGSVEGDSLTGAGSDDLLLGGDGPDILTGGAGVDSLLAGAGDDVLAPGAELAAGERYDGGTGRDVLMLALPPDDPGEEALLPSLDIRAIEAISLENGADDALTLSAALLAELSDGTDTDLEALLGEALDDRTNATIYGDAAGDTGGGAGDRLTLDAEGGTAEKRAVPVTDAEGRTLDVYDIRDSDGVLQATLGIDADIDVQLAATV